MPTIRIPSALRSFTAGNADIELSAATVRDALTELERRHPGIGAKLLDGSGAVKPFIRIYVRAEDIGGLSGLDTPVGDRDEIDIIPAMAGGAARGGAARGGAARGAPRHA
jgi:molybdopterin converting factor small subunit